MRVKKQKQHRRAVRFYKACFGFREPFKVLCDGTFVHHVLVNKIVPVDTQVADTLGAQVKLFTTSCVLEELKSLGKSFTHSHNAAQNLLMARCDHEQRKSAASCLVEVIGEKNDEHFVVATQDAELQRKFEEIPGVPLIYALRNRLFLKKPSTSQHEYAKAFEEGRSHMTEQEYKLLKMKKASTAEDDVNSSSGDERVNPTVETRGLEVKKTVQFKKKGPKRPNPLSCLPKKKPGKKAKKRDGEKDDASEKGIDSADKTSDAGKKKRKRSRKKKTVAEPTS